MSQEFIDFKIVRKQINPKSRGHYHKSWALFAECDRDNFSDVVGYLHETQKTRITYKGDEKLILRYTVEWKTQTLKVIFQDHITDEQFFSHRFRTHTDLVNCIQIYYQMIDCLNDFAQKINSRINFFRSRG